MTKSKPGPAALPRGTAPNGGEESPADPNPIEGDGLADSLPFEDAMGELEGIVRKLESGGEPLEEALEEYANAIGLLKVCHKRLQAAERRVEILSGVDAEGNPVTEPVAEAEETMEQKRHSRTAKRTAGRKKSGQSVTGQLSPKDKLASDDPGLF